MPTLAAKYTLNAFSQAVARWRGRQASGQVARPGLCRVPWVFTQPREVRLNHLHLLARASDVGGLWPGGLDPAVRFSGEVMKQLKARFEALPAETQERLKSQAKARREIARRAPSRLDESLREQDGDVAQGPWGWAASNGWVQCEILVRWLGQSAPCCSRALGRFPRHRRLARGLRGRVRSGSLLARKPCRRMASRSSAFVAPCVARVPLWGPY